MKAHRRRFPLMLCLALLGGGGEEAYARSTYKETTVANGGMIRGAVQLVGEVPRMAQLAVAKDTNYCGVTKTSPRLRVSKSKGVQDAIVWLEGITEGKKKSGGSKQLVLDQFKCRYIPHVLVLPLGASLDIVNSDPILHNVHTYDAEEKGKTLFNIAQPIKGQRTTLGHTLFKKPGLFLATCDAGHPWMSAYIMVAEHPYYALTDAQGRFVLENVPPGRYKIKMWHEGVAIAKTEMENGKPKAYRYEEPYEEEQEVTVSPLGTVSVTFSFELRSSSSRASSK